MNDRDTDQPQGADDALQALAGEYVLGVLSADERLAFEDRLRREPALPPLVAAWEARLQPLSRLVPPIEPSAALWPAIERRVGALVGTGSRVGQQARDRADVGPRAAPGSGWRRAWQSLPLWRGLAATAMAAALVLAVRPGLIGTGAHPRYVVVLVAPGGQAPGWVVQVRSPVDVELAAVAQGAVPRDRALELWTKADDWPAPVSLGLVRPGETVRLRLDQLPALQSNQLFEITLEPPTGSPTGRPTGPIQYIGRAVELRS